jgi:peptide chain release factor 1
VSDHRVELVIHDLPAVLDGDLDRLLDAISTTDQARRLAHLDAAGGSP